MAGISSKAMGSRDNKREYNGNEKQEDEFSDGSGLEVYDFNARTFDPQIGRFIQIDPWTEEGGQESLSPYHFAYNNPIRYNDPDGKCPICPVIPYLIPAIEAAITATTVYVTAKLAADVAAEGIKNPGVGGSMPYMNGSIPWDPNGGKGLMGGRLNASSSANKSETARGSNNAKTKESIEVGQEAHRQEQAKLKKEGADIEVTMTLKDGTTVRKDAVRPDGTTVIIKPNTKTGKASAAKREEKMQKNDKKTEIILYDPANPIFQPGSPTYIGPKKVSG